MKKYTLLSLIILIFSCSEKKKSSFDVLQDVNLKYKEYTPTGNEIVISRAEYLNKLKGFWLAQCIANWTGLVTEHDKLGNIGEFKTGDFYTREDWGKKDQPNIWGSSDLSETIDFIYAEKDSIWGADDDTDIEYIYQELLFSSPTLDITGEQIRQAWLDHINIEEENYLWVSNQKAFDLMLEGKIPPETSDPDLNEHYEMIDAQLTTEIFGFYAPTKPMIAVELAHLAVRTTARYNAAWIAEFNIIMYSLASLETLHKNIKDKLQWMAKEARKHLPNDSYSAKMFDFVSAQYQSGVSWETARDSLHYKYQIQQADGYQWSTLDESCNGCFASGINFGAFPDREVFGNSIPQGYSLLFAVVLAMLVTQAIRSHHVWQGCTLS